MWISYAQILEDIHLMRCLSGVHHDDGFYIDVGSFHPEIDSVTKLFYDAGWRGINIEPSPIRFPLFAAHRPRDINLQLAVSDRSGEITFYDQEHGGLGTTIEAIADAHAAAGYLQKTPQTVPAKTLTEICDEHVRGEIHFLKIDVEGAETAVLRGLDFSRYRPWVMCIECSYPMRLDIQVYDEWEPYVISRGYKFAYTDTLNRYYIAEERPQCQAGFLVPADHYVPARMAKRLDELESLITHLRQVIIQ